MKAFTSTLPIVESRFIVFQCSNHLTTPAMLDYADVVLVVSSVH